MGAISNEQLYLNDLLIYKRNKKIVVKNYITSTTKSNIKVNVKSYEELYLMNNLSFNSIIADCEGALPNIFNENPKLFQNLNYLQIEWDWEKNHAKILGINY